MVIPWIIGFITFMALETLAMVYSNVLRDHVNKVSNNIVPITMLRLQPEVFAYLPQRKSNILVIRGALGYYGVVDKKTMSHDP